MTALYESTCNRGKNNLSPKCSLGYHFSSPKARDVLLSSAKQGTVGI